VQLRTETEVTGGRRLIAFVLIALTAAGLFVTASSSAQTGDTARNTPSQWRRRTLTPPTPGGEWRPARGVHMTEEQRQELEKLESIGYLTGHEPAPPLSGVTIYDATRSSGGLNLYVSGDSPGARLVDMEGSPVHEWRFEFADAWPDYRMDNRAENAASYWFRAHLFENGDVLAIFTGLGLVKVDKDSNLLWKYLDQCHHDVHVTEDGRIYVLTRRERTEPRYGTATDIYEDAITILSADGEPLGRVSMFDAFWNSDYVGMLKASVSRVGTRTIDIFHTNRLERLTGRIANELPHFREGNVLVSLRNLNAIAVVDMESEEIVWAKSGLWLQQHCSSMLDNGHILLFDNHGDYGSSRIVEYDPIAQEIVWVYRGNEQNDFYSDRSGAVQRLPNGNTLIAESNFGRAFEVTPAGEIVWEFINPARAGDNGELIASLFEVTRLPQDFPTDWAK